jgi:hypothetical protein
MWITGEVLASKCALCWSTKHMDLGVNYCLHAHVMAIIKLKPHEALWRWITSEPLGCISFSEQQILLVSAVLLSLFQAQAE